MGDVNSIIAAPYQPNIQSNMQALSQGNALLNAFDAQSAAKEAGPMAAAGDWEGARNSLLGAGQIDQAAKVSEFQQALQDRARKMSDEKLSDAAKTWGLVGNGAVYADTPEKYSTLLSVLSKNGIDVSPYKDFTTGRQAALALSGQAKTILDQEKAARDEFRSNISGGLVREATNKDFNGNETSGYAQIGPLPGGRIAYTYTPAPEGLDIGESLGGKAAKASDKDAALNAAIQEAKDGFAAKYPDKPKLSDALARVAGVQALKGVPVVDWKFDNSGAPSEPVLARKESSSYQAQLEAKISDEAKRDFGETPPATVVHEAAANKATRIVLDENGRWKPEFTAKAARTAAEDKIDKAIPGVKALYARDNPGKPELDDAIARSIAAQTVKGKEVTGWEHNSGGRATGATYKEGQSNSAEAVAVRSIQKNYKDETGDELPYLEAAAARHWGAHSVTKGPDGKPVANIAENTAQGVRMRQIALKELTSSLQYLTDKAIIGRASKADVDNVYGREQRLMPVLAHVNLIRDMVGGPELDTSKLSPAQKEARSVAEGALGYLTTKTGYGVLTGIVRPNAETPAFIASLKQAETVLKSEMVMLENSGHAVVAQSSRQELDQAVGDLAKAPSVKTLLKMLNTVEDVTKRMAQAEPILTPSPGLINPKLHGSVSGGSQAIPVPQAVRPPTGTPTPAAPTSSGSVAQPAPTASVGDAISRAHNAIAKGAPRDQVIQRLKDAGYDTSGF